MKADYENSNFNNYLEGPGAELDAELQPGAQSTSAGKPNAKLYLSNIPTEMSEEGLVNLCKSFGKIVPMTSHGEMKGCVRLSDRTAFVTCENVKYVDNWENRKYFDIFCSAVCCTVKLNE